MSPGQAGTLHSETRLPSLDGLRGVAIALVLLHSWNTLGGAHTVSGRLLDRLFDLGWVGVQLFFVLSGCLITGILLDTRQSPAYLKNFFWRRSLRIFPLYYATLVVAFVLLPVLGLLPSTFERERGQQLWFWLYLQNWRTDPWQLFPHYWSLAVEEQFYLLWPFVVRCCTPRRLLQVCAGLAVTSLGVRLGMRLGGIGPGLVYTASVCRMDALALGAAVAVIVREPALLDWMRAQRTGLQAAAALAVAAVVCGGFQRDSFYGQTIGYSALSLAFAMLVLALVLTDQGQLPSGLRVMFLFRPLRTLGRYSYAVYVFHRPLHKFVGQPLLQALPAALDGSIGLAMAYLIVMGLVVLLLAEMSYRWVEGPFLRLKRRFDAG